ncbi:hypothetical protein TNCV_2253231 [Trichonephila clavipes]|nr:hypothetical protein TNCV_2253231 [Trichonephila clavipes]
MKLYETLCRTIDDGVNKYLWQQVSFFQKRDCLFLKRCELTVSTSKTYSGVRLPNIMPSQPMIPLSPNLSTIFLWREESELHLLSRRVRRTDVVDLVHLSAPLHVRTGKLCAWMTDRSVSSRTVAQHIESVTHHSVSARTIRRRLQQSGLSARRPLIGVLLTKIHRCLRR